MKPKILITMGDPAGVGPEIILKAMQAKRVKDICDPFVIGDENVLKHLAKRLRLKFPQDRLINFSSLDPKKLRPGSPTVETSQAMIGYIEEAVCLAQDRAVDAIVTAPISKAAAKLSGFRFPGHTEFIAHLTGAKDFVMMLGGKKLKVVLVTIHEPISKVPRLVTREAVLKTIKITDASFKEFLGFKRPRIAVAGLNPHAGEAGIFGVEEKKVIAPAVKKAREHGINAVGPLPPDTVFYRAAVKKEFDCVVCMYHDQGLGPLKLLHFEDGINATLGLPLIRTSVDHGTAYDIAWKGIASPESLVSAIETASMMATAKTRRRSGVYTERSEIARKARKT